MIYREKNIEIVPLTEYQGDQITLEQSADGTYSIYLESYVGDSCFVSGIQKESLQKWHECIRRMLDGGVS